MKHELYAHQKRFYDKNPDRGLLVWETGCGKTVSACMWLNRRPGIPALVVCPKGIVMKWRRDLKKWGVDMKRVTVVSTDKVKKIDMAPFGALVLDEAQNFSSPLFDKGRSQRATKIYEWVRNHSKGHTLLLTATPVRSTPWNIHTLACYLRTVWDIKKFRTSFFYLTDMFGRWHYEKRRHWRNDVRPYVERISDIVLMSDCADVPKQTERVIDIPGPHPTGLEDPSWIDEHRAENGRKKFDALMKLLDGYRKAIVVIHYTEQIRQYVEWIGDERQVFVLQGKTKDQDRVIREAREADDCVFIIQASMGAGFDAAEFSVMIFASMDFKYISMVQMKGRIKRINNLHENLFLYLIAGPCDRDVYDTIMAGRDFDVLSLGNDARSTEDPQ